MMTAAEQPNIFQRLPCRVRRRCAPSWQTRRRHHAGRRMESRINRRRSRTDGADAAIRRLEQRTGGPHRREVMDVFIEPTCGGEMKKPYRKNTVNGRAKRQSGLPEQRLVSFG